MVSVSVRVAYPVRSTGSGIEPVSSVRRPSTAVLIAVSMAVEIMVSVSVRVAYPVRSTVTGGVSSSAVDSDRSRPSSASIAAMRESPWYPITSASRCARPYT